MNTCTYMYICMCVYIYIYIYKLKEIKIAPLFVIMYQLKN